HSPALQNMAKVIIIESKAISEYLNQLEEIGEEKKEYQSIWGYSLGETEPRVPLYEYPDYDYKATDKFTNISVNPRSNA
ncbi:MAG: KamA family protein, partial [Bacteroidales bacterium]|nr:KamA family protein [Bacteroidales bacterium]